MNINPMFMELDENSMTKTSNGLYRCAFDDSIIWDIGKRVPMISTTRNDGVGIAVINEIHLREYGSVVFFKVISVDLKEAKHIYRVYQTITGATSGPVSRPRSFENSAAAMDLGMMDSPRDTFRKSKKKRTDDYDDYYEDDDQSLTAHLREILNDSLEDF